VPIKVVEADVDKDIGIFLDILNRNRENKVALERFQWLYLDNPQGKARAWLVIDEKSAEAVAFTSVLPRLVKVDGRDTLCWNCCDFSVDKRFRTLGVAVKLRRKAKEGVDNRDIRALYAHPNDKMKVIHERVGHPCLGKMERYVKILKSKFQLQKIIRNSLLLSIISPVVDIGLRALDMALRCDSRFSFELIDGIAPYDVEYDKLFNDASKAYRIVGDRSADYLNWRYGRNPLYCTDKLIVRENGILKGYIVYYIENNIAVFKDILCLPDKKIAESILAYWIKSMRKKGVHSISTVLMEHNPFIKSFLHVGFKLRPDESSVYVYARKDDDIEPVWTKGSNWYMTVGDRDV